MSKAILRHDSERLYDHADECPGPPDCCWRCRDCGEDMSKQPQDENDRRAMEQFGTCWECTKSNHRGDEDL